MRDFSTVLALHWQKPWHAVLHETLRGPCGWSRQVPGVAVACPYPLPSNPNPFPSLETQTSPI